MCYYNESAGHWQYAFSSDVRGVAVSSDDAAKIRKDAETAKENGENLPEDKDLVWDAILEQSDGDEEKTQALRS